MSLELYDWQEHDVGVLEEGGFVGLLNIQTGGGKTILSVNAALRSGAKQVLIIAPLNTYEKVWGATVREWAGVELRPAGNKNKAWKQALADLEDGVPGWFIVNPSFMGYHSTDVDSWAPDMLISDEVHNYNKPSSKWAKRWIQLGEQTPMKLALSGTPARRDFARMWSIMRHLWPELDSRFEVAHKNDWVWKQDRMVSEQVYTNQRDQFGRAKKATNWVAEKEPGRLIGEAPTVVQHFRRVECCFWHPYGFLNIEEPLVIDRTVSLTPVQKRIIKELEAQSLAWLDDNPLVVDLPLEMRLRIRQVVLGEPVLESFEDDDGVVKQTLWFEDDCKSPVVDEVLDIMEHLDEGEPVIVYLEAQRFAPVLVKRLREAGYTAEEFSGVTVSKRDDSLRRFGKDLQVLVATTSAIANGTDGIQHVCSTEIVAQRHSDDTLMEQQDARTDRMGARKQVVRYVIGDDLGYAEGQLSAQLEKRLRINRSTRRV